MDQAHVQQIWRDDGETHFAIAGFGMVGSGWRLDYAYTLTPPTAQVLSIDHHPTQSVRLVYRPLGENWYIRLLFE